MFKQFLYPTGSRLQILREQLQAKMRVKRAENRKIQESQQRLDNEEMSEEEEEEEMTDEEEGKGASFYYTVYTFCASLDCQSNLI